MTGTITFRFLCHWYVIYKDAKIFDDKTEVSLIHSVKYLESDETIFPYIFASVLIDIPLGGDCGLIIKKSKLRFTDSHQIIEHRISVFLHHRRNSATFYFPNKL